MPPSRSVLELLPCTHAVHAVRLGAGASSVRFCEGGRDRRAARQGLAWRRRRRGGVVASRKGLDARVGERGARFRLELRCRYPRRRDFHVRA
jgi:hypothetical protein